MTPSLICAPSNQLHLHPVGNGIYWGLKWYLLGIEMVFTGHFGQALPQSLPLNMVAKVIHSSLDLCGPLRGTDVPL